MNTKTQDTSPTDANAVSNGIAAAQAALAAGSTPIFWMDEGNHEQEMRDYAMGWNSVCATDANRERFTDLVIDPKPYAGPHTVIRPFLERTGAELPSDLMRLNFTRNQS